MLFRENCCTFGNQSKLNPFKLGMKRIRHSTFTFMKQLCSFSLWWNIFIKEIPTKLIFEIFSWIKRYHNNGAFQQNFSISVWRDLCQLSVWSICGYCYYQRADWELSSVRYNLPAHCLALLLILIPANQKLWCHAFLCLSTNFRWLTKDLYYHTPDRHMLFKLKKKRSWKTKAFLNDLDIPETSDLRKKDIEEKVVLELWVILENVRMGPLPKMSNLWLGKSWQLYVMLSVFWAVIKCRSCSDTFSWVSLL